MQMQMSHAGSGPLVRRYEPVLYNPSDLRDQHSRYRRSLDDDRANLLKMNLYSHGR